MATVNKTDANGEVVYETGTTYPAKVCECCGKDQHYDEDLYCPKCEAEIDCPEADLVECEGCASKGCVKCMTGPLVPLVSIWEARPKWWCRACHRIKRS